MTSCKGAPPPSYSSGILLLQSEHNRALVSLPLWERERKYTSASTWTVRACRGTARIVVYTVVLHLPANLQIDYLVYSVRKMNTQQVRCVICRVVAALFQSYHAVFVILFQCGDFEAYLQSNSTDLHQTAKWHSASAFAPIFFFFLPPSL